MQNTMLVCDSPKNTTGAEHVCNVYIIILMFWNVRIVEFRQELDCRKLLLHSVHSQTVVCMNILIQLYINEFSQFKMHYCRLLRINIVNKLHQFCRWIRMNSVNPSAKQTDRRQMEASSVNLHLTLVLQLNADTHKQKRRPF